MLHANSTSQLSFAGMDLATPSSSMSRSTSHQSMSLFFHKRSLTMSPDDKMTLSLRRLSRGFGINMCTVGISDFEVSVDGPVTPGVGIFYDTVADEVKTRCFNEISSLMGMTHADTCEIRVVFTWHDVEVGRIFVDRLQRSVHLWTTSLYDWNLDACDAADGKPGDAIPSDAIMSEVLLRIHAIEAVVGGVPPPTPPCCGGCAA